MVRANYDVAQVFIDLRSSINILFKEALDQMQVDLSELHPMSTSLLGFVGHEVKPLKQVKLPLSLGEKPLWRTRIMVFTAVEVASVYNVILGMPTMSSFKAVVSTYHQKAKFPMGRQIGDQTSARKYYVKMVRADLKKDRVGTTYDGTKDKEELRSKLCRNDLTWLLRELRKWRFRSY